MGEQHRHPHFGYPAGRECPPEKENAKAAGAGDGVYHPAPFLKKYGA